MENSDAVGGGILLSGNNKTSPRCLADDLSRGGSGWPDAKYGSSSRKFFLLVLLESSPLWKR